MPLSDASPATLRGTEAVSAYKGEPMKREWTDPTIEPITSLAEAANSVFTLTDGSKKGSTKD